MIVAGPPNTIRQYGGACFQNLEFGDWLLKCVVEIVMGTLVMLIIKVIIVIIKIIIIVGGAPGQARVGTQTEYGGDAHLGSNLDSELHFFHLKFHPKLAPKK